MAESTIQAAAPGIAAPGARPGRRSRSLRRALQWAGVLPFGVYVALGLAAPTIAIAIAAFKNPDTGSFTLSNIRLATEGSYLPGLRNGILLAIASAIVPGIFGLLIAYAIHTAKRGRLLRQIVITASGVFANFGGVPLAFLFIAALGTTGVVTGWLSDLGWDPWNHGFTLYDPVGVFVVYMYFQIPLMVLVILPALEGLRPAWREAAENLGAGTRQYWRHVGGPVLFPAFLGCVLLLFGSAFSAYATAEALTGGTVAITSIQIGALENGNVLAGQQNVGYALGLFMVVIIGIVMIFYTILQRRAARWLR
ncbi:MAG: ABC transporter permease [Streptosporangiaceae bacterium]|jgi:putative spermidine/putrescine transport system permease protein|nr:ABC transporter permease [Actinomycetota bacterium]